MKCKFGTHQWVHISKPQFCMEYDYCFNCNSIKEQIQPYETLYDIKWWCIKSWRWTKRWLHELLCYVRGHQLECMPIPDARFPKGDLILIGCCYCGRILKECVYEVGFKDHVKLFGQKCSKNGI